MKIPGLKRDKNAVSSAFFGAAFLLLLIGPIEWCVFGVAKVNWDVGYMVFGGAALYLMLGIVARWFPLTATYIGALFYCGYLILAALESIEILKSVLFFTFPIFCFAFSCRDFGTAAMRCGFARSGKRGT